MNQNPLIKILFLFLFIHVCLVGFNQTITGIVLDSETRNPIWYASVYINGTFVGTTTDKAGNFALNISGNTAKNITISAISYQSVTLTDYTTQKSNIIYLMPKPLELGEVIVHAKSQARERKADMKLFRKELLGSTFNARNCVILNEEDIWFNYGSDQDTLKAFASKALLIENRALGYRITYFLDKFSFCRSTNDLFFSGHIVFNSDLSLYGKYRHHYEKKRKYCYQGSRMQFVRSLWSNELEKFGFHVENDQNQQLEANQVVFQNEDHQKFVKYPGNLNIFCNGKWSKLILLKPHATIEQDGSFDPAAIMWRGDMGIQRLADLVPYEYGVPLPANVLSLQKSESVNEPTTRDSLLSIRQKSYPEKLDEMARGFQFIANSAPAERIYIQTSKDIYGSGEDVWFKAYVFDNQHLILSDKSKTLYVQVLTEKDKAPVWQEKYEIQDGLADGRIELDTKLPEGNYFLTACTQFSIFDDSSSFHSVRKIIVTKYKPSHAPMALDNQGQKDSLIMPDPAMGNKRKINFYTFPEGGYLVSGIKSCLAFKAVDDLELPVAVQGTLFENNNPVQTFKSTYAGMGSLYFIPVAGKRYSIRLSKPDLDSTFYIPEVLVSGLCLQRIQDDSASVVFRVVQSQDLPPENISLRVQSRGIVYSLTTTKLVGSQIFKLPRNLLPQGISEITLFDGNALPVAERLIYTDRDERMYITTSLSKVSYNTREMVNLHITVKDAADNPVKANLGVSVFDHAYQDPLDSSNIFSYYFLSSEIEGRIYNPAYYVDHRGAQRDSALNLLLMTQGWRKYVWNEANLEKYRNSGNPIVFDFLNGSITHKNDPDFRFKKQGFALGFTLIQNEKLILSADSSGQFQISPELLKAGESDYVYCKPFGPHQLSLRIGFINPFDSINHALRLKNLTYPLTGTMPVNPDILPGNNSGSILIPEVTIKGEKPNTLREQFFNRLKVSKSFALTTDWVCMDGVLNCPYHDKNQLYTTKPVPGYTYLRIHCYYTPYEFITTFTYPVRKFRFLENELLEDYRYSSVKAYYGHREFYQPNHNIIENMMEPDYRNTLLWTPSVTTDEKGEATLSFYCSDIHSRFVGRIEGISDDGLLGAGNFRFNVRKIDFSHTDPVTE